MKLDNPRLKHDCHTAMETLARVITQAPEIGDGALLEEICRNFGATIQTLSWLTEFAFKSDQESDK